ncbi:MAG: hypothetical protein LBE56_10185 [Tannerella sp.]|jgi:hypothetical protein|nr:hypothetical protein [Tannerella sp.]
MKRDYYIEYFEFIDMLFREFINDMKEKYPGAFHVGDYCCEIPVICFLTFYRYYTHSKDLYNHLRKEGKSRDEVHQLFKNRLYETVNNSFTQPAIVSINNNDELQLLLQPFRNQILIYVYNERHLNYLIPLICRLNQPVVLVSEFDLSDRTDLPDYVSVLTIEFLKEQYYSPFLYEHYPHIYHYCNTFAQLMQILQPCCTIVLEGCLFQHAIIANISKRLSIPSICIQHGWPSMLLCCSRNMQYDYFFSWGRLFNDLWKEHNPIPKFVSMGYMYPVLPMREKISITFFLQGPYVLHDKEYFDEMLDFLLQCAISFPTQMFCVREHPEYRIPDDFKKKLNECSNIRDVSKEPLSEIYAETILVVSHSSSCIMEGIVHKCIPFVFDPTFESRYCPDIEKMTLGIIANTMEEAVRKMNSFILHPSQRNCFLKRNDEIKKKLFASYGKDTLRKMVKFINRIVAYEKCKDK